ncbi:hypothetical protein KU392_07730 [Advenella alkanexedens]|uniref:Uncharacterized protein n=1 Tax=Advenella alkanexedens TaxID=1481665 RepID=A0ABS6NNC3_9BURK|nr:MULTISPECIES: hypothetical protein [Advenella]MBV4397134.1 hypothetical protein [Advenella alkanexedens]MDD3758528.1 hypothetical protein [Advenella sp.]
MIRPLIRILVLTVGMTLAMPVWAKESLPQISSRLLRSLKIEQFDLAQEMKLFGEPAMTVVFTRDQSLDSFMRQIQEEQTVFRYADVIADQVFLHASLTQVHVMLRLFATAENSFRGELSLIENQSSATLSQSSFNERVAARFLPWIPAGAQLLMDIELPGREKVLQQLYWLNQSAGQTRHELKARLLASQWVPDSEDLLEQGVWHKGNQSLYVFVHAIKAGTGVYLMKKNKQAE